MQQDGGAPLPATWYDFADVAALTGYPDDAFTYLRNASHSGYNFFSHTIYPPPETEAWNSSLNEYISIDFRRDWRLAKAGN